MTRFLACSIAVGATLMTAHAAGDSEKQNESQAFRERVIATLPEKSVKLLDQPYVERSIQGKHPASNQTLDLYVPEGKGPFPLIVWIHGGAWKGGDKELQGVLLAKRWLPEGFAIASLNYRFVTDEAAHPAFIEDCNAALNWLRAHASEYRLDERRVGVVGMSAGGHIAALAAFSRGRGLYPGDGPGVQALALWCGIYDVTRETGGWDGKFVTAEGDDFMRIYPNRQYDAKVAKAISPVYLAHKGIPPVWIGHGEKDDIIPISQSEKLAQTLRQSRHAVEFHRYPEYDHNLWKDDVIDTTLAFFKERLKR